MYSFICITNRHKKGTIKDTFRVVTNDKMGNKTEINLCLYLKTFIGQMKLYTAKQVEMYN